MGADVTVIRAVIENRTCFKEFVLVPGERERERENWSQIRNVISKC